MTTQQIHQAARKHIIMFAALVDCPPFCFHQFLSAWKYWSKIPKNDFMNRISALSSELRSHEHSAFECDRIMYYYNEKMHGGDLKPSGDYEIKRQFWFGDFFAEYISGGIMELKFYRDGVEQSEWLTHKKLLFAKSGTTFGRTEDGDGEQIKVLCGKNGETLLKYTDTIRNITEYYIYEE